MVIRNYPAGIHLLFLRLWRYATRNAADPADINSALSAGLLAAMLVTLTVVFSIVDITQSIIIRGYRAPWYGYVLLFIAFVINRFFSFRVAAIVTCLMFPLVLFGMFFQHPDIVTIISLCYLAFAIILATIILRTREAVAFALLILFILALLPVIQPVDPAISRWMVTPFAMSVLGAVLSIVFSIHRNMLEKIRLAQLTASEQRYRQIVESIRAIAYEAETETFRPMAFEGAVEQITGYTSAKFLSGYVQWDTLIHPDDIDEVRATVMSNMATQGLATTMKYRILRADGSIAWVRDTGMRTRDDKTGKIISMGLILDITEIHNLQERLHQSEKMEAVGMLAGGVAHDFNNQLTGIMGFAELLRIDSSGNPAIAGYADNILAAATRSKDLTGKLLAFSRKGKFLAVEINIHKIIIEVVSLLRHSIDKRIGIGEAFNADQPLILGDPAQIQNALLNLALNACDAMTEGGNITFSTDIVHRDEKWCIDQKFDLSAGNFLRIAVQDTGAGIPHEHMKHIFEPFFTTKPVGKGTGLGLASVYGAMKNHRGAVMVESAIGKGTIFTLHLPLLKTGALGGAGAAPARAVAQSVSAARILLVDDEDVVVKMTETLLKKMGHAVITARDGKSAIELFERERAAIDLVLLDLVMPVMSGQDTFGRLRQIDPCLQIILISGYSKDGIAQGLLDKGAAGFLQKPFRCDELAATVSDVLHRRRPP